MDYWIPWNYAAAFITGFNSKIAFSTLSFIQFREFALVMIVILVMLFVYETVSARIGFLHDHHHHHKYANRSELFCVELQIPRHGIVSCHYRGSRVSCQQQIRPGTVADFECDSNFVAEPVSILECLANGTWSSRVPKCVADCGKQNAFVTLIMNGALAVPGTFPWQAAIYNFLDGGYEFWCGGSLISEYAVITAAHCTWKIPAKNLIVALGKFFRDFNETENDSQMMKVVRVEMIRSYQDVGGNYNGDLSVVFLEMGVKINSIVRPICIDWKQEHMDNQLVDENLGTALGWGLTENDTFSEVLKSVQLPVKSDEICIAQQHKDFRKFVTYTSFCAGFRNGSGVCNGDSGGGLAFIDKNTDTWYLQGVVSISPRRKGTSFCDPNFYTVFTKVTVFVKWLIKMKELEQRLVDNGMIQERTVDKFPTRDEFLVDVEQNDSMYLDQNTGGAEEEKRNKKKSDQPSSKVKLHLLPGFWKLITQR